MKRKTLASLAAAASLVAAWAVPAAATTYQTIDLVAPNHLLYDMTDGGNYPSPGDYTAFDGVPFRIGATGESGFNIWHSTNVNSPTQVYELPVNVFGARTAYTVMNLWYGTSGHTVAEVAFFGSGGATYSRTLEVGVDIRDHYAGSFVNTINGTTTVEIFDAGSVRLDRQAFVLPEAFATQTLERIVITNLTHPDDYPLGQSFVAAVTVAVPEPGSYAMLLAGLGLVGWRLRRRPSLH